MPTAIKISGRTGRNNFINDNYEPMQITHNNRPVWVARAVAPRYIFHTGKGRWVISKQIDDGYRCWAFVSSDGSNGGDPSACKGPWTCCDEGNEWKPDPSVSCAAVPATHDKFVQLRMTLDADMRQYGLIEHDSLRSLWKRLDFNGNNVVSLAEIDKMVVEMVAGGTWPAWLNNKPALMRAYKKTILVDGDGDDWVEKKEFHALLLNIFWFNKLWQIFDAVDGSDRRIDVREFTAGMSQLGLNLTDQEAAKEFASIDTNHGGQVLFVEFCGWVRKRVNPDASPDFDADIYAGEHCGRTMKHHHTRVGSRSLPATHEHFLDKKCFSDFDALEQEIKNAIKDRQKILQLWKRLDFNGNNIVSLAEIDKLVVERYPLLNHKPALMRAYKRTIKEGNGDDWVQRKEFKALLTNLFYFNKLFWLFEHVDGDIDRRMTFQEFKKCMSVCGCGVIYTRKQLDHDYVFA
eukprot:TRINITY_DN7847_c0_g1_i2.p1 TRINITY_DN7847_c0_g1~~TRINITY_DN7847_c0_g1_i2.p1  ORF type:complete len:461 (+),score=83.62 TRINITY_DN7847_c0_g1_i2:71-1453(+)